MARHFGVRIRRFSEIGHDFVSLENELLRVEVVASKGADIVSFLHKPSDTDALWRRSVGLRPACLTTGRGFLDAYEGGWQEIFPNGGPPATVDGAPLPMHGEVSTVPWDVEIIEDSATAVEVAFSVRTSHLPLRLVRRMRLVAGSSAVQFREVMHNESSVAVPYMWGHHPAFGPPFLSPSCRIDTGAVRGHIVSEPGPTAGSPPKTFRWPFGQDSSGARVDLREVQPRDSRVADRVCLSGIADGWFAITNRAKRVGFGMAWDASVLPFVWIWRLCDNNLTFPWYGREYAVAIEPWTSPPDTGLEGAIANGTARSLAGRSTFETGLVAVAYSGRSTVHLITQDGQVT